jgi:hypothetical protein
MVHSRRPTARSISSSVVAKRSKPTGKIDQTPERSGHVNTENPWPLG